MTGPNIFRFYNSATIYSLAARIRQKHTHGFSVKIPASSSAAGARLGSFLSRSVRKKIKTVLMFLFSEFNTCWARTHYWGKMQILSLYVQKYQMRITKRDILFFYQKTHNPRWSDRTYWILTNEVQAGLDTVQCRRLTEIIKYKLLGKVLVLPVSIFCPTSHQPPQTNSNYKSYFLSRNKLINHWELLSSKH